MSKQYFVSVAGDETQAQTRLTQTVNDGLRAEFGKRTVHDVVSGERDQIMEILRQKADIDARKIGVQVMDVRLKRVELPQEVSESVYQRMEAERKRVANELRSQGAAEAEKIRADADRQREVILAEAYRTAQHTKGEGDAKAAAIYAAAYGQNPEFYAFYRSMEAYRQSFKNKSDVMVLEPSSEFFKYMKSSGRQGGEVRRANEFACRLCADAGDRRDSAIYGARRMARNFSQNDSSCPMVSCVLSAWVRCWAAC